MGTALQYAPGAPSKSRTQQLLGHVLKIGGGNGGGGECAIGMPGTGNAGGGCEGGGCEGGGCEGEATDITQQ